MGSPHEGRHRTRDIWLTLVGVLLGIATMIYISRSWDLKPEGILGIQAPEIEFTMENGQQSSLAKKRGMTVLLYFWATWCEPCMAEMPELRALEKHFANDGFVLLAFNLEESGDENIRGGFSSDKMPQNIIFNFSKQALRPYNVKSLPLSIMIDKHGIIQKVYVGPRNWMDVKLLHELDRIITN